MPIQNRSTAAHFLFRWLIPAISLAIFVIPAQADTTTFVIDPQDLSGALKAFAVQSHREIFFAPELARGRISKGVNGKYDDLRALKIILEGTGLDFSVTTSNAILVRDPMSKSEGSRASGTPVTSANTEAADPPVRMTQGARIQTAENANLSTADSAGSSGYDKAGLNEIIVTAQKRTERLQDVPIPVTVLNADTLVDRNQIRLQDYFTSVPGLSVTPSDFGGPQLTLRGLTTGGFSSPTVGITVDDVPYGSSSSLASGQEAPDIDPSDLERVEVLRGPQGTLYGASSLGGLVKFVTVDPSTDAVSGRVQAGISSVYNGAELGYNFRAAVNVPLSDTLAVRASGFTRVDPGYIDNVLTGQNGINEVRAEGGRLSALWRQSPNLSLKVSALVQHFTSDGSPQVERLPGLTDLQQDFVRGAGESSHDVQAYSAILKAKIGSVDLTAVSGYSVNRFSESLDDTSALGTYTNMEFGVTGTPLISHVDTKKLTQEVRLSSPIGQGVEWLVGAYYNHEKSPSSEDLLATTPLTGEVVGSWVHIADPSTFTEYAAFADVTVHFTDQFDLQVGGRESQNRQDYSETFTGPYATFFLGKPVPFDAAPEARTKDNSFTYLITPRFKLSPDFMLYARLASGYRPGGPNVTTGAFVPPHFNPDTTRNYELGAKGDMLNHTLSFDASLYYIDWKDIQLQLINPSSGVEYFANGSKAKSQGLEFSLMSRPLPGLAISAWVTWADAVLTEDLPSTSAADGASGDRLPYGSRFSGSVSLQQDFPLGYSVHGFIGGSASYVGDREGVFASIFSASPQRQIFPAYARMDLRGGAKYESWAVNLFVNNLADKRGLLTGGLGTTVPAAFTYIQPRTVGLSVSKTF